MAEVQQEGASVVELLQQRQAGLAATLGQQFPEMRNTTWQSESSVQAAAQTLTPQMTENKKKVTVREQSDVCASTAFMAIAI